MQHDHLSERKVNLQALKLLFHFGLLENNSVDGSVLLRSQGQSTFDWKLLYIFMVFALNNIYYSLNGKVISSTISEQ